jgi:hypothetical protein
VGEREPDLLIPERLLCIVDAIEEQMSLKRRLVEILERQEEEDSWTIGRTVERAK